MQTDIDQIDRIDQTDQRSSGSHRSNIAEGKKALQIDRDRIDPDWIDQYIKILYQFRSLPIGLCK